MRSRPRRRGWTALTVGIIVALAVAALSPRPATATLLKVQAFPEGATTCDSVTLFLSGTLPDPCYTLRGMRVSPPELLDTMGPIPVYRIRVRLVAEEPNPALEVACATVLQPYARRARLGRLPFGHFLVDAVEYLHPYPADATPPVDSSRISIAFDVRPDTCRVAEGCVLLGFAPANSPGGLYDGCTGRTEPGGRACFAVTLQNPMPVGALQTEIVVQQPYRDPGSIDLFTPVDVKPAPRAAGFQAAWSAEGSTATIVLFSTTGATIAPGQGPVLHVCYEVAPGTPDGVYTMHFRDDLVAAPGGEAIPPCPTFARIEGRICVGQSGPPCDLNGDGVGDVRDVLRLVRCILAGTGGSDACPDSVRARADCNGDGLVDVRDVLCCVRRILAHDAGWHDPPFIDEPTGTPARIGFEGDASWITPFEGVATLRIEPGEEFGGMQWVVDPGAAARVRDVLLENPEGPYALAWGPGAGGAARIVLYHRAADGEAAGASAAVNVRILLEPVSGSTEGGEILLRDWRSASWDASPVLTQVDEVRAALPANAAAGVPAVLPARPNPFVASTEIVYSLPAPGRVSLRLFDVTGRLVRTLVSGRVAAGVHRTSWDGRDARGRVMGSGVYFVRFEAAGVTQTQRLLRLR